MLIMEFFQPMKLITLITDNQLDIIYYFFVNSFETNDEK